MPPIGLALGGVNFKDLAIKLKDASADGKIPAVMIKYGAFIQTVLDFAILAFIIFLMVKAINSMKKAEAAAPQPPPPGPTNEEKLLMEIRDALRK
jgi:large conductance mechanosensitive channel